MNPAQPDDNDLAERIAVGDVDVSDPVVQRALADDPGLAQQVEEIRRLQGALSAAARLERAVLAEAVTAPARPWWLPPRTWLFALAASFAAVLAVWTFARGDGTAPDDATLGAAPDVTGIVRAADGTLRLRWNGHLRPGDYYAATLRRPSDGVEIAHSSERLLEGEWTLPPLPVLPPTVRVEIEVLDATRRRVSIARADTAVPR